MPTVFLAGSRRFTAEIEQAQAAFRRAGVTALTAGKTTEDTLASERAALLRAFTRIGGADAVYVVTDGYAGKTVCMEIAYAWARGKPIYSSAELEELSARGLVERVMKAEELSLHIGLQHSTLTEEDAEEIGHALKREIRKRF